MPATRRTFLKGSLAAGATLAAGVHVRTRAAEALADKPNIVFCIADDWSFGHASAYDDPVVKTPTFDRIASEGALFTHSFCIAPTCSPSRAGILTGQPPHRLEEAANLWSILPAKFPTYTDLLKQNGYAVGLTGKGYGPGADTGRPHNAAGKRFRTFNEFLDSLDKNQPFSYWFGSSDPHRPYQKQLTDSFPNLKRDAVTVPPFLPDSAETRDDLLDYYAEIQRFDQQVGQLLTTLEASGRAANTIVVITSDNGMPFPHAKANLYDPGTRMPLAIRWPGRIKPATRSDAFISHLDFAPTFLAAAGLEKRPEIWGQNILDLLTNPTAREEIFTERERHAYVRASGLGYPCRAVRTRKHLYIRNFTPDRWPAGDPELEHASQGRYGDIDAGPTKRYLIDHKDDPKLAPLFTASAAKRPAEELYDVTTDPTQLNNLADDPAQFQAKRDLRDKLDAWMKSTSDPRASSPATDSFDKIPYLGGELRRNPQPRPN